jgi:uncharacterized protein
MTESALATVRRFSRALHDNDLDEACGLLHEQFVLHEAGGLPYSGDYHGPQGFRALLTAMRAELDLAPGPMVQEPVNDDTVISRFTLTFTARRSGRCVTMGLVELYRVRDGRIVELDAYYKDPSAVAALLSGD